MSMQRRGKFVEEGQRGRGTVNMHRRWLAGEAPREEEEKEEKKDVEKRKGRPSPARIGQGRCTVNHPLAEEGPI